MKQEGNFRRWAGLLVVLALVGASCGRAPTTSPTNAAPVTLTVWRVFDDPRVFDRIIEQYQVTHPNVTIVVEQKPFGTFELEVADAIAANTPPDIFMIRNDWLPRHIDKLQAMPENLFGTALNVDTITNLYPPVVSEEAVSDGKVFGIPLALDTLALYYNKDHFAEAGIATPPATWSEFIADVQKLTKFNPTDKNKIDRAGAAIGTARTVNRASDILMLLMLQNHTPMVSADKQSAIFNGALPKEGGGLTFPGTNALEFYTGFADPKKTAFTWNNDLPQSIDAFVSGQASMIFGFNFLQSTLLQKNPTLNYGVGPMPQVDNAVEAVDYPTYWLEVVSRNTTHPNETWEFMKFLATDGDTIYQQVTGKPVAKKPPTIPAVNERAITTGPGTPWSFQGATAATWFRGKNPAKDEQLFNDMIENVVTFKQTAQVAIDNAAGQITKLLQGVGL